MVSNCFKVLVVGGGPIGLTAAHALDKAGIDFLLLERRPKIVEDAGAGLVLSPVGLRALAQLGLTDAITAVSSPLSDADRLNHNGRDIGKWSIFNEIEKTFGIASRLINRQEFTQVLFDSLSPKAQQCLLPGKKLSSITTTKDGITATCADGTSYSANIVIGADGAHSQVRNQMHELAAQAGSPNLNASSQFLTTYRCLWIRLPKHTEFPRGTLSEIHGRDAAIQFFVGENSAVLGLYERLEKPTRERVRYTEQDEKDVIERWGHLRVAACSQATLQELYSSRQKSGLVSLEEGVLDEWSWNGRIVLVGDAAHKFTPSTGAGCNNGIIDVVVLANELHAMLAKSEGSADQRSNLAAAFARYQTARRGTVVDECALSGRVTATSTWDTPIHKFLDLQVLSRQVVQRFLITSGAKSALRTPVFQFLDSPAGGSGSKQWMRSRQQIAANA